MGTSLDTKRRASARTVVSFGQSRTGPAHPSRSRDRPSRSRDQVADGTKPIVFASKGFEHAEPAASMTTPAMTTTNARILIADDQADIVSALKLLLIDEGFEVVAA